MFTGTWISHTWQSWSQTFQPSMDVLGKFITSIFGDSTYTTLGTDLSDAMFLSIFANILTLITCIGIVVMAVKGIKRVFSIFFMGIR